MGHVKTPTIVDLNALHVLPLLISRGCDDLPSKGLTRSEGRTNISEAVTTVQTWGTEIGPIE